MSVGFSPLYKILIPKNSSIIDLGWAEMLPLQFAAAYPRFLTHEPIERQPEQESSHNFDWLYRGPAAMGRDRKFYLDCLEQLAHDSGGVTEQYYDILRRPDEIDRYWWIKSVFETNVHQAMVACGWTPHELIARVAE